MQLGLVLNRKCRQVSVSREIGGRANRLQQAKKNIGVPIAGMQQRHDRLREPRTGVSARLDDRERTRDDLAVGREPDEAEQYRPGKPHRLHAVQQLFPPSPGGRVVGRLQAVSMDDEIDVRDDHDRERMCASPSSSSTN